MIAHLTGTLITKSPTDGIIVDVGGVGYRVIISLGTFSQLPEIGNQVKLNIHTHVREDQLLLYGFTSPDEKSLFLKLIGISNVGPKTALSILSGMPHTHLMDAIASEDHARLSSIPGVGKKTAERIIVELRDKITKDIATHTSYESNRGSTYNDTVSALMNLGYQRGIVESALKKIKFSDNVPIEDAIKLALRELCRA